MTIVAGIVGRRYRRPHVFKFPRVDCHKALCVRRRGFKWKPFATPLDRALETSSVLPSELFHWLSFHMHSGLAWERLDAIRRGLEPTTVEARIIAAALSDITGFEVTPAAIWWPDPAPTDVLLPEAGGELPGVSA